ncbi:MAG TPA: aldo/keto reductase [Chlamydiales bacterium]|nr:aldo/keto reductase [Chlamydiales bacterium]
MGAVVLDVHKGVCKIEGVDYPIVGFGTWALTGDICTMAVRDALEAGYRMIDTATMYKNFEGIAKALKGHDPRRLYIISKVWHDHLRPGDLRKDLHQTLERLQIDYLDTYYIHWPNSQVPIEETLGAMDELRKAGKIRHIGLSNFTVNHLKKVLEVKVPITWVQVEMHPHFYDGAFHHFCKNHGIAVQAWRPLNYGLIKDDAMLASIGKKYGKTPSQVSLRWIVQHECLPLPGSKNKAHLRENLDILDFALSKEEMQKLDQRALSGTRFRTGAENQLGFDDEFDFSYEQCWPKNKPRN